MNLSNMKGFLGAIIFFILLFVGVTQTSCGNEISQRNERNRNHKVYKVTILERDLNIPTGTYVYIFNYVWVDGSCLHATNGNQDMRFCNIKLIVEQVEVLPEPLK